MCDTSRGSDCTAAYNTVFLPPTAVCEIRDERLLREVQNAEKSAIAHRAFGTCSGQMAICHQSTPTFCCYFNAVEQVTDKILFDFWLFL